MRSSEGREGEIRGEKDWMPHFYFSVINPGKEKRRKKKKRNTNQTARDAALHGWIRVTVGLSPWEHCSAINK